MKRFLRLDVVLIVFSSLSWISLMIFTFQLTSPEWKGSLQKVFHGDLILVKNLFLSIFFLSIYLLFNDLTEKYSNIKEVEWNVTAVSIVCLFFHLIILWLEHYVQTNFIEAIWLNFLNNFNILIGTVFSANCFFYFKRLILLEKNLSLKRIWNVFEIMIFLSIFLTIFNVDITEPVVALGLAVYSMLALYLSTKMRWVAFLKKKKKIKLIVSFSLYLVTLALILQNFFFESFTFGEDANHLLVIDCAHKFFLLSTFTFVLFYLISSILILLFHLPTSSVFDEKAHLNEAFKKLSFSLNQHKEEGDLFKVLLDIALSSSKLTVGFLSSKEEFQNAKVESLRLLSNREALEINEYLEIVLGSVQEKSYHNLSINKSNIVPSVLKEKEVKSVLCVPMKLDGNIGARLVLLNKNEDDIDEDLAEVISSYCLQASVSIENIKLFVKTIENERYQEEVKIAKTVKSKLLPQKLDLGSFVECAFFSTNKMKIGGDYYETIIVNNHQSLFVIGDVSGSGVSAAFNMAQLKGIFHTVIENTSDFDDIPRLINSALLKCYDANSFVSLSFFFLDNRFKTIKHYRCGHLPSYFIQSGTIVSLNPNGIGLGIIDNNKIVDLLELSEEKYNVGDVLFCFTDGLSEAVNQEKEYFGTNRLKEILNDEMLSNPAKIIEKVDKEYNVFLEGTEINDDVTFICLKFL